MAYEEQFLVLGVYFFFIILNIYFSRKGGKNKELLSFLIFGISVPIWYTTLTIDFPSEWIYHSFIILQLIIFVTSFKK